MTDILATDAWHVLMAAVLVGLLVASLACIKNHNKNAV